MRSFKRLLLRLAGVVVIASAVCLIAETLLEPKLRVVELEGVPISEEPPSVTFMTGAVMDPLVHTNPFLQLFSPLEALTPRVGVPTGGIQEISDTSVVFVWEIFGRRSVWILDRHTQKISPRWIAPAAQVHLCSRTFPAIAGYIRNQTMKTD